MQFFTDVVLEAVTPGKTKNSVLVLNWACIWLICFLFGLLFTSYCSIHIVLMLALAIGLFVSALWLEREMRKADAIQKAAEKQRKGKSSD